jgi:hypothetical protein
MLHLVRSCVAACLVFSIVACSGYDPAALDEEGEQLGAVQERQTGALKVGLVSAEHTEVVDVLCPNNYSAFGLVYWTEKSGGYNTADLETWGQESLGAMLLGADKTDVMHVTAVCGETWGQTVVSKSSTTADATAVCPDGYVATGGGGDCWGNRSAKLYRSRPNPDSPGSTPNGWRASCSGATGITTHVNCLQVAAFGGTCRTERKDEIDNSSGVGCKTGEHMTSGGAYCSGSGNYIRHTSIDRNITAANASCHGNGVHAYGVCCTNLNYTEL